MTQRQDPIARTNDLLDTALQLAVDHGWRSLTHHGVAVAASVSNGLVVARLGTKQDMLRAVMRRAVNRGVVPVVAEGLAVGDKHACRAGEALRAAAGEWVRSAT